MIREQECYFLPLGGVEQIGMNFNVFGFVDEEGNEQCIIVDAGVSVCKELGINLKIASIDSIIGKNIIGIICTHAHEDHIGAIPFVLDRLRKATVPIPIYATKFTMCLIQEKMIERNIKDVEYREVQMDSRFKVGCFDLEFIHITHSIPEPNMIVIKYGGLTILHTGDWKLDHDPVLGPVTNEKKISKLGDEGVDFLLCDSTNALVVDPTKSEGEVRDTMDAIVRKYKNKRIIVSCFSSNVARIKAMVEITKKYGRKLCLLGRSFTRILNISYKTRYLDEQPHIIPQEDIDKYPANTVVIMCTGSQGEQKSVLHRVTYDLHNFLKIDKRDVVVFSAKAIPGNEKDVAMIKNNLMGRGVEVLDPSDYEGLHASGHPSQPELKRMFDLVRPKYVVPVHGDRMHLVGLENFARSLGYRNTIVPRNGSVIRLNDKEPRVVFIVQSGVDGLDGKVVVNMESQFLTTRARIGEQGCLTVVAHNEKIDLYNCGILPSKIINGTAYNQDIKKIVKQHLVDGSDATIKATAAQLSMFFYEKYGKNPVIIIHKV